MDAANGDVVDLTAVIKQSVLSTLHQVAVLMYWVQLSKLEARQEAYSVLCTYTCMVWYNSGSTAVA